MKCGILALLAAVSMAVLTGCGGGMTADDAKEYAQAVLDASYKGEFDSYMELTDSTEEEAREMYEGNVDTTMEVVGFEELGVSEEMQANYRQLFLDMAKQAKYSLGDVSEIENGYEIEVTVEPFTGMSNLETELTDALMADLASVTEIPSEEELNEMTMQKMYDLLSEKVANPEYGEAQTMTLRVTADSDNVYSIPEEDTTALDSAMFPSA
ncbi:hypothetical protein FND36_07680 [Lachnospiraceae bacterium KGMB03038]|nr:hypothetical protein FND36_07680 [Lachnospiraceae bacterium KGMB03038]